MFKKGDRVVLVDAANTSRNEGELATVEELRGDRLYIKFDKDDIGYNSIHGNVRRFVLESTYNSKLYKAVK